MNTYKQNDKGEMCVADASGKLWECEVAHPLPLPEGLQIDKSEGGVVFGGAIDSRSLWTTQKFSTDTHWLARRPLPPVPKPKSQEELDEEAFTRLFGKMTCLECIHTWKTALAYARKEKP